MRAAPPSVSAAWRKLQTEKDTVGKKAFKAAALKVQNNMWDGVLAVVTKQSTSSATTGNKSKAAWQPYHQFSLTHGEEQTNCMLQLGTISSMVDPKLVGSSVPYPKHLLIWSEAVKFVKDDLLTERQRVEQQMTADGSTSQAIVGVMHANVMTAPFSSSSPSPPPPNAAPQLHPAPMTPLAPFGSVPVPGTPLAPPPPQSKPGAVPPLVQQIRKTHAAFDRSKRDWSASLASSASCPVTAGTPMEGLLRKCIEAGSVADASMLEIELRWAQQVTLSTCDEGAASDAISNCLEELKKGAKYAQALKLLMKLPSSQA